MRGIRRTHKECCLAGSSRTSNHRQLALWKLERNVTKFKNMFSKLRSARVIRYLRRSRRRRRILWTRFFAFNHPIPLKSRLFKSKTFFIARQIRFRMVLLQRRDLISNLFFIKVNSNSIERNTSLREKKTGDFY